MIPTGGVRSLLADAALMANVPNAKLICDLAQQKKIRLTPPPKPVFEEKMLFALLWNRNLREFWRQRDPTPGTPDNELQQSFYQRLAEANRRFREGGAAEIPGWRTDRGKILIRGDKLAAWIERCTENFDAREDISA